VALPGSHLKKFDPAKLRVHKGAVAEIFRNDLSIEAEPQEAIFLEGDMAKQLLFLGLGVALGAIVVQLLPIVAGDKRSQWFATDTSAESVTAAEPKPLSLPGKENLVVRAAITETVDNSVAAVTVELLPIEKKQPCQDMQFTDIYEEDGTVTQGYYCADVRPQHPYESYATATLETMAYGDAKAAEILGIRFSESNPDKSFEWMLRASALTKGDYHPILWMVNHNYSEMLDDSPDHYKVLIKRYVLTNVIEQLGGPSSPLEDTANFLASRGMPPESLVKLDGVADHVTKKISDIAYEVTGEKIRQGAEK